MFTNYEQYKIVNARASSAKRDLKISGVISGQIVPLSEFEDPFEKLDAVLGIHLDWTVMGGGELMSDAERRTVSRPSTWLAKLHDSHISREKRGCNDHPTIAECR
jgi:hypothetical protein